MDLYNIAVVGATGAVGRVFLDVLASRSFPLGELRLCASERSLGKEISFADRSLKIELATPEVFRDVHFVFISADSEVSRGLTPLAVESGAIVIDDSSVFRMDEGVPLVVPEVNSEDLEHHKGIVSIPNCSTTPLVMILKPLMQIREIRRVIVDTYQSVSGTGSAAVEELKNQSQAVLENREPESIVYPHQIAFNALPHIEYFLENGYTNEEIKMLNETRKILHDDELPVSATCVRIPVMLSHSEAIHIEFDRKVTPSEVKEVLNQFDGVTVVDDPTDNVYPMPVDASGRDEVFVGRIREDVSHPNGIVMWVVTDNLRKGAATNAIQIAEEMISRNLVTI